MVISNGFKVALAAVVLAAVVGWAAFLEGLIGSNFKPIRKAPMPPISSHPCHPQLVRYDLDVLRHAYELDRAGHRDQAFNYLGTHYKAIAEDECR